jgi:glycosyltransferase involved in cell wall biosynthesis
MRILFIISDLTYHGAAKQLKLLARRLPAASFQRRVCVLRKVGPWVEDLRSAGVVIDELNRRWKLDLSAFGRLRHLIRAYQADVLHVWGLDALRATALAGGLRHGRLVATASPPRTRSGGLAWLDRRLLNCAKHVTVASTTDAERSRLLGVDPHRLVVAPPGVEPMDESSTSTPAALPPRTILCIGPLERHKGFRNAIWVLDILRFLHTDLQLAFVGTGTDRNAIERFAHDARVADRVHFLGERTDLPALLASAELVWAPTHDGRGTNAVLEAMAAGRPVVASNVSNMAAIVAHGECGFLTPPGDQAAFARHTRLLLDDAELRRRMGEAGRRRALDVFPAAAFVQRYADLYRQETAATSRAR